MKNMRNILLAGAVVAGLSACTKQNDIVAFSEWTDPQGELQASTFTNGSCPVLTVEDIKNQVRCSFTPNSGLSNGLEDPKGDGYSEIYGPSKPMDY